MLQQLLAILGEAGVVEGLILPIDVKESLEEQVVPQLLAELPLTPNRVQRHQEAALQRLHPADGMVGRNQLLGVDSPERRHVAGSRASHPIASTTPTRPTSTQPTNLPAPPPSFATLIGVLLRWTRPEGSFPLLSGLWCPQSRSEEY